jgi:hypothetical protein
VLALPYLFLTRARGAARRDRDTPPHHPPKLISVGSTSPVVSASILGDVARTASPRPSPTSCARLLYASENLQRNKLLGRRIRSFIRGRDSNAPWRTARLVSPRPSQLIRDYSGNSAISWLSTHVYSYKILEILYGLPYNARIMS